MCPSSTIALRAWNLLNFKSNEESHHAKEENKQPLSFHMVSVSRTIQLL